MNCWIIFHSKMKENMCKSLRKPFVLWISIEKIGKIAKFSENKNNFPSRIYEPKCLFIDSGGREEKKNNKPNLPYVRLKWKQKEKTTNEMGSSRIDINWKWSFFIFGIYQRMSCVRKSKKICRKLNFFFFFVGQTNEETFRYVL